MGDLRIGSLFSGIGGLELGLEWAGVGRTVWQVEQDPFCLDVLAHHWPDAERFTDVRDVGAHNLQPVDVICGGFPCQDISYVGKGAGLAGARSGLWYEFARIVGEVGPEFVVVENVAALLTRGIDAVLGTLADLGYNAEWSTLRASDVGAPHRRERVFVVAYADRGRCEQRHAGQWSNAEPVTLLHAMGDPASGGRGAGTGFDLRRVAGGCEGVEHAQGERCAEERELRLSEPTQRRREGCCCVGNADHTGPQGHRGLKPQRHTEGRHCAGRHGSAAGGGMGWQDAVAVHGCDDTIRLIPREAAQAGPQSALWPVAHGVPGRVARLRAIGNAVVPQCAEVVGRRLLEIAARHA